LLELVAIGPQGSQRWKKTLVEDKIVRLGRAPPGGWAVPWDLRISREHCDLVLKGDRLYVRLLDTALNPVYRLGEAVKEFNIRPGEAFRIGQTTFRIDSIQSMQTVDDAFDDPQVQSDLQAAAQQPKWPAADAEHPVDDELDSIRGQISDLKAQLEADAKREPSAEAQRSKTGELQALRQQIESLKAQMSETPRVEDAAAQEEPPQEDSVVKALQDEIEQLRSKVDDQDRVLKKQAAERRKQSADERQDEPADERIVLRAEPEAAPPRSPEPQPEKEPEPETEKDLDHSKKQPEGPPAPEPPAAEPSEPRSDDKPKNAIEAFKARLAQQAEKKREQSSGAPKKKVT